MTELEKGPRGVRRGRGARARILGASRELFREQGINGTGLDLLCAVAEVSKRTLYQHFRGKDELIAEHLRRFDPDILPEVFDRADLTPRERLLAAFEIPPPLCPFIAAAVEIHDPDHPARVYARDYKRPLPRGSPKPPARPAPPTPNSSASNWRCSWTAPRLAAESSTPTPSPPPPPSPSFSSTTPSPRQRRHPSQGGSCERRLLSVADRLMDRADHARTFAYGSCDPLHRAVTHIAHGEESWHAGLERQRLTAEQPERVALLRFRQIGVGEDEAASVKEDALEPRRRWHGAYQAEES